ncbi:hypothetical protein LINPERHAP2_LOCUS27336, partial [Linum perenne]
LFQRNQLAVAYRVLSSASQLSSPNQISQDKIPFFLSPSRLLLTFSTTELITSKSIPMAVPSPSKNISFSSSGASASRPANPNLRNSESIDPKRRSFVGSPFPKPSVNTGPRSGGGGGFHPNTPVNSPSDYRPRRNSTGKENMGDRENGTEQNRISGKVQPAAASKGCKNFMSPTISAASKVNPSPRKKILAEKDDPVRTSISFSLEKLPCMEGLDAKLDKGGLNQKKEVSFDSTVTYLGDKEEETTFQCEDDLVSKVGSSCSDNDMCSLETEIEEKDLVNLDPSFKISPGHEDPSSFSAASDAMPPLSPLDADPHMAPYDPKTNYLSPRPRFLHYKHNPRVEIYLQQGSNNGNLKESFLAESLRDAEVTEDEVYSDLSQEESDDTCSDVAYDGLVKKEEEEEVVVSEPDPSSECEAETEVAEVKEMHKGRIVTRTKFVAILLVLASVGLCISFYNTPVMDPSVLNNLNFPELYVPPQLSRLTRESFEQVTQSFQLLLRQCLPYLQSLVIGFIKQHNMVPLEYANLTTLFEDSLIVEGSAFSNSVFQKAAAKLEDYELWPVTDGGITSASVLDRSEHTEVAYINEEVTEGDSYDQEAEDQDETEVTAEENTPIEDDEETDVSMLVDDSVSEADVCTLVDDSVSEVEQMQQGNPQHENLDMPALVDESATLEAAEDRMETVNEMQSLTELKEILQEGAIDAKQPQSEKDAAFAATQDQQMENCNDAATTEVALEEKYQNSTVSLHSVAGILALVVGLLAAALALFYRKNPKTKPVSTNTIDDVTLATKRATQTTEEKDSPMLVSTNTNDDVTLATKKATQTTEEKDSPMLTVESSQQILSSNWVTEVEYSGEDTCTSAMSGMNGSFTRSHEKRGPRRSKGSRRESSASSGYSVGSQSYGSFTTYEKIPAKHNGTAEDEAGMITPVRRSSRLRSKVSCSPDTSR